MGPHTHQRSTDNVKKTVWQKIIYVGEICGAALLIIALLSFVPIANKKYDTYAQLPNEIKYVRKIDSMENIKTNERIDVIDTKTEQYFKLIIKNQWSTMSEKQKRSAVDAIVNDTSIPKAIFMEVMK